MAHWNWLDWVLATIVLLSVLTAIWKGFVAELISLASVLAALIIAALYYEPLSSLLLGFTRGPGVARGVSFVLLFAAVMIVGALISVGARKLVKKVRLQWFDRFLGGIFGLVRGLLIDCIVLLVMMAFAIQQGTVEKSALAPYFSAGSRVLALAMPVSMRNGFRASFEKFKKELIETDKKATEVHTTEKKAL
ncbi:MAG TPA: CvpA family protein [Terriglobia bacterium]|nr:CvpA family protein [Terriglobia bacterium]